MQQRYMLTIWGLLSKSGNDVCGAQAVIAIMNGEQEVDRFTISGKWQSPSGYRRSYTGKSGLTALLLSGPDGLSYVWEKDEADPYRPIIAWRRRESNPPGRDPVEVDVQDGRAEYLLSGPYSIGEGGRIEVVDGKLLFTGSNFKIN